MNLFILNNTTGKFYFKPDTAFCKENSDFYLPDNIQSLSIQTLIAVRIIKGGKCIKSSFAKRYYSKLDYAINIFHSNILKNQIQIEDLIIYSSLENSFYFSASHNFESTIATQESSYLLLTNGNDRITMSICKHSETIIDSAIETISSVFSVKTGDIVAFSNNEFFQIQKGDKILLHKIDVEGYKTVLFDFSIK